MLISEAAQHRHLGQRQAKVSHGFLRSRHAAAKQKLIRGLARASSETTHKMRRTKSRFTRQLIQPHSPVEMGLHKFDAAPQDRWRNSSGISLLDWWSDRVMAHQVAGQGSGYAVKKEQSIG